MKQWRDALYRVGIFVFKDAFREESFSGFSLYDDVFPIIYVNNSPAKTRQIFTLFHELAHLLFHTSGIDPLDDQYIERLPDRPQHIEVLCNRFAAQFLVPEKAFEAAFSGQQATERTAEIARRSFHVSREFIFRKFLDRGLITQDDYGRAARRWAAQKQKVAAAEIRIGASLRISAASMSPSPSANTIRTASTKRNSANILT